MENLNLKLQNLFLEKKYSELIKFIENEIDPKYHSGGVLNVLGVSIILKGPKSKEIYYRAINIFKSSYLKEKKTKIGLNSLTNFINVSVDLFDLEYSANASDNSKLFFNETLALFDEAEKYFGYDEKLISAIVRVYKKLTIIEKILYYLDILIKNNCKNISITCSYIYYNSFINNWSQETFFDKSKLLEYQSEDFSNERLIEINKSIKKKIRIGFFSSDIKPGHSITYFLNTVLSNYNKEKFEIYLYLNNNVEDKFLDYLSKFTDKILNVLGLSDLETINLIRKSNIDIIFDLMGVTSNNRIQLFKNRLAPIQISWLGYCNTTGLKNMDYIISDRNLIYENEENLYSEKIIFMSKIWNCHSGLSLKFKKNPMPYFKNKFITFGSLNNFAKINKRVLEAWIKILKSVNNSKLILKSSIKRDINFIKKELEKENLIKSVFVENYTISHEEHASIYKQIDICLDTFPYNGVTTSFEAIWMGVPVITMKGYNFNSRCGESINKNLDLNNLIADDFDSYVNTAVKLAKDTEKLKMIREKIFNKAPQSPLFNSKEFSDEFYEKIYELYKKNLN